MKRLFLPLIALALLAGCKDDPATPEPPVQDPVDWPTPAVMLDENFDAEGLPEGWAAVDANADGFTWRSSVNDNTATVYGYGNAGGCVYSMSYSKYYERALRPDDYLVTPALKIPNGNYELSYMVAAQDASYPAEHYEVHYGVMQEGQFVSKGVLFSETMTAKGGKTPGNWYTRTISLAPCAGQEVCLAFRHCETYDQFYLKLDNVRVADPTQL